MNPRKKVKTMKYFVLLSIFCLILVTVKANPYMDSDLMLGGKLYVIINSIVGQFTEWEITQADVT